jgi:methionine synthase II (cobalamin-independent)
MEAQRLVMGELGAPTEVNGLPYLVELPSRGPGSDMVGRAAALLVDLPVDLQPSGWRLTDAPGRDAERAAALWRNDLDDLAEAADGYRGRLKVQVTGPWTLVASLRLNRGERVVNDPGARRDVVASLAEGIASRLATVQRLVPGAELVVQLDEPSLPAVLAGRLPRQSGFGRLRPIEADELENGLQTVTSAARGAGAATTAVHCCAKDAPFTVLRRSGAEAVAVDVTALDAAGWESVAVTSEAGLELWAGLLPTTTEPPRTSTLVESLTGAWKRVGLPASGLSSVTVSPTCGLAGASPTQARAVLDRTIDTARALAEVAAEA